LSFASFVVLVFDAFVIDGRSHNKWKTKMSNRKNANVETVAAAPRAFDPRMVEKLTRYNALRVANGLDAIDEWHGSHAAIDMAIHEMSPRASATHGRSTFAQYLRDNGVDDKYGRRVLRSRGFNAPYEPSNHSNYLAVIRGADPSSLTWN